ncbi:MAG TPA: ABC transporter permease, partial [Acidimicrobiia bacterium]|nr:ABC transporter permease [Acidimicrobiia bacterium]
MRVLLPFIITGLVTGSLYGLAGVGLVLTFRTSGVLNFAHGAIAAGAAFVFYTLHVTRGVAWPLAAVATIAVFSAVGSIIMQALTRPLSALPDVVPVVATVGILLALQGYLVLQFGNAASSFPEFLPTSGFVVSGVHVSWGAVISVVVASAGVLGLYLFLRRSRVGLAMRAVVDDPVLLGLTGARGARIRRTAWAIGCGFAAASGILIAPSLGLDANLLTMLVVQAFGACAIGLFSSLPLAYLGGLAVGLMASLGTHFLSDTRPPWSAMPSATPFLVLVGVLLVVPPNKLPGRNVRLRVLNDRVGPAVHRNRRRVVRAAVAGALLLVPAFAGSRINVWTSGIAYFVIFSSLALLLWTSGQISLCHAAFAAVGATSFAHLSDAGLPWFVALLGAGLLAVPVGALVAVPAIRLSGIYLALLTLGFGIVLQVIVYATSLMFGAGLFAHGGRPEFAFVHGSSDRWYYYVVLGVAAGVFGLLQAMVNGRVGLLLRALSETPTMLRTHGLAVNVTRTIVFCLSAFVAAIGGALLLSQFGSVS